MKPADSAPATTRRFHRLDISGPAFWARDFAARDEVFAQLRTEPGLTWHAPAPAVFPHSEPGFWAVTRQHDIAYISRHPDLFTSSLGISMDPMPVELQRPTSFFLTMDPPRHTRYRRLISAVFTPKQVRRIEIQIRANAAEIVDEFLADLLGEEPVDLVDSLSRKLPMRTVSDMIGIDRADRETVAYAAEAMFGSSDEEYASLEERAGFFMSQFTVLHGTATELAARRRRVPRDDLMSAIVTAEVDGHRLTDEEIGAFMVLLASAGNDTLKQTTSHGLKALIDHPAQREWLLEDPASPARRRGRGVHPLGDTGRPFRPPRGDRYRGRGHPGAGGRETGALLLFGESRRGRTRRAPYLRPHPRSQSAFRFRRRRSPLLPGCVAGQDATATALP